MEFALSALPWQVSPPLVSLFSPFSSGSRRPFTSVLNAATAEHELESPG